MAKPKTLRVLSRAHTALSLQEPMPNPEKPGEAPPLRTVVLNAHPVPGAGQITELTGDDVEVYKAWRKANPNAYAGMIDEVGDDYEEPAMEFGHEPILERALKDRELKKAAKGGSSVTEEGPVPAEDLSPASIGTPDDSAGGEPRKASQPGEPEPEQTARRRGRQPS